jgi:hypothetical protein
MTRLSNRTLPLVAMAALLMAGSTPAIASSHMDAPLITLDDAANTPYESTPQNGRRHRHP